MIEEYARDFSEHRIQNGCLCKSPLSRLGAGKKRMMRLRLLLDDKRASWHCSTFLLYLQAHIRALTSPALGGKTG
jgi:hypothetical protein